MRSKCSHTIGCDLNPTFQKVLMRAQQVCYQLLKVTPRVIQKPPPAAQHEHSIWANVSRKAARTAYVLDSFALIAGNGWIPLCLLISRRSQRPHAILTFPQEGMTSPQTSAAPELLSRVFSRSSASYWKSYTTNNNYCLVPFNMSITKQFQNNSVI